MQKNRSLNLDILRGFAVLLMIIFHFAYDLTIFHFADLNFSSGFWYWLPRFIVFCFLYSMGVSLVIVYGQKFNLKHMLKRFYKIAGFALLITVTTYFMFPKNWVYFGTLHCITVATLIGAPLARYPKINLALSLAIIFSGLYFDITYAQLSGLVAIKSIDFIPIYPWYCVVGIAIFFTHQGYSFPQIPANKLTNSLARLGQKSLPIYLIHQPLIYGLLLLIYKLK